MFHSLRDRMTRGLVGLVDRHTRTLAAILEGSGDPVLVVDRSGTVTYLSDSAAWLLGRTPAEVTGRSWEELGLLHEEMASVRAACARVLSAGEPVRTELSWLTMDGQRYYEYTASPIRSAGGTIEAVMLLLRDVTDRKELEQALQQRASELADLDRRKDDFLAMLSHELRNPLAAMQNALQLAGQPGDDASRRDHYLRLCDRQVRQMSGLLDDLLDVSRAARNKIHLQTEPLDLNRLVTAVVEDQRPLVEQPGVDLILETSPDPVAVDADPTRLSQVIHNLIGNAVKFTPAGGSIHVCLARDLMSDSVFLTVEDTGAGIAPEILPHIFEPFAQGEETLDRSRQGMGLGLALVKGLVELHGGTVEAHSEGAGLGSRFRISLPTVPAEQLPIPVAQQPRSPAASGSGATVLIVDDNRDIAETLADILETWGFSTRVAHDGLEALEAASAQPPGTILLDIGLPGMDGYEVAAMLRRNPDLDSTQLIAITGYGQPGDRSRSRDAGCDFHLTKPVDPAALLEILQPGGNA